MEYLISNATGTILTSPAQPRFYIEEIAQDSATLRSGKVKNKENRFLIKDKNNPTYSQWMDEVDFRNFEKNHEIETKDD